MGNVRIGLFGVGLEAYWPQFDGLKGRLEASLQAVEERLHKPGVDVVSLGLVDTSRKGLEAGHRFRQEDVDLIFLHVTTYALSATVLPVVRRARVPVIVLNLQPQIAIDYAWFNSLNDRTRMTGEWLAYCAACTVPELANVFRRTGIDFHQVTGVLEHDPVCWAEVDAWVDAARVAHVMSHNRLGLMGHDYSGMLDVSSDLALQCAAFGSHVEMLEVDELAAFRRLVSGREIADRVVEFRRAFDIEPGCDPIELERAARTSVALDRLAAGHELGSMAYYYKGTGVEENEDAMSSMILGASFLTSRGIPVAGEYEVKNAQAMKILDTLGAGGSFTEFYALDYQADVVLMGHDGPGHLAIADGKPRVRPLAVYHGKVGRGLSIEMSVRRGPVTLLSVLERGNAGLGLLVAEGESVSGPILEIGNTNSRYRFPTGARQFVNEWTRHGPAHHCAVGTGHVGDRLEKLARLLKIECTRI
jgi:L-arabinose isomerase